MKARASKSSTPNAPNSPARGFHYLVAFCLLLPHTALAGGGYTFWAATENGNWFDDLRWDSAQRPDTFVTAHLGWTSPYTVNILNRNDARCLQLSIGNPAATLQITGAGATGALNIHGTQIDNVGTVLLGGPGSSSPSNLVLANHCTADGNGTGRIRLESQLDFPGQSPNAAIVPSNAGLAWLLVQNADHVIEGAGAIGVRFQNDGLVHANVPGGELVFNSAFHTQNNATIRASNGGAIWIAKGGISEPFQQSGNGEIIVEDGSALWLWSAGTAGFSGGELTTTGTGVIHVFAQGFPIEGTTLTTGSRIQMNSNVGLHIGPGGLTNDGIINTGSTGFIASNVGQSATLGGSGRVQLEGGQLGKFLDGFSYSLVNGPQHTIGGVGQIQAYIINNGTIAADRNGLATGPTDLVFQQAAKTNNGLITATGGGRINVFDTQVVQSSSGVLRAGNGSSIALTTATITGGTLETTGSGVIYANGSSDTLSDVAIETGSSIVAPCGRSLHLAGTIANDGTITVDNSNCGPSFAYLRAPSGATVAGAGEIRLARTAGNATAWLWGDGGPANLLVIGSGQRITGSGGLRGTIRIEGTLAPDQTFNGSGPIGSIDAAANIGGGAIELTGSATFECDLASAASFDRLTGSAAIALDGTLDVAALDGFEPGGASTFQIISGSAITGDFSNAPADANGIGIVETLNGRFTVTYAPTSVTLSSYVPAPPPNPGDLNCDGSVNFFDIDPFILALFDPQAYIAQAPNCHRRNGDLNVDGRLNFFDIDPFVACIFGACP